ncbi:hypothetical protein [Acinetobacter sp.]|jgi:hypothetical protein|uniref:hypothetical protein n=1 Tax=Acinetobacter sp. TaxID=472 RepID=UPI002829BE94|nr:hypothetical protein [Acinetobacter sp.]MDR0236163.1 hypothetical protein [Acinetobacter sp.]
MMRKITFLLVGLLAIPFVAQAKTLQQWEQCADKAGRSVNVQEVGNIGYEAEIKKQCGTRPVATVGMVKPDGKLPYDVIQAEPWKKKFQQLTGKEYTKVKTSLVVSSAMKREGDWLIGSGYDPKGAGASKAVIAVNTKTGKVMALMSSYDGVQYFGFDENTKNIPQKLQQWISEEVAAG